MSNKWWIIWDIAFIFVSIVMLLINFVWWHSWEIGWLYVSIVFFSLLTLYQEVYPNQ